MPDIENALRDVTDLISLPEVYLRVQRLMDDPASDIYDFAEVISVDPNLSARVLKVVNSAYYGFPVPVESIPRAVNLIGIGQLHNMVLSVSAISSLSLPNDILPIGQFWRASLFVGVLARLLGRKLRVEKSERLFVAGLLHDIGHLVLYSQFPQQAIAAREIADDQGMPVHEAQLRTMGIHYGEIGAMLMSHWKLPEALRTITRHQVDPAGAGELSTEATLIHLSRACSQIGAKESESAAATSLNAELQAFTGLSQEQLDDLLVEARSISAEMENVILA